MQAANPDLCKLVAAAADLCRKPLRHGVRLLPGDAIDDLPAHAAVDCCLRLEARSPDGHRVEAEDLDLEIFQSGDELNLTLAWSHDEHRPLLWQGGHPVWMDGKTGERCSTPERGTELESLARRLRDLLI